MKKQPALTMLGASLGMMVLILDSKTALMGAMDGIRMIGNSVLPSLFPFLFLSAVITGSQAGEPLPFLTIPGKIFRLPKGAESILIPGFLGGYPLGAQAAAAAWKNGDISRETAERMLAFCSNAGPAFLFGILSRVFSGRQMPWLLWFCHIAGAWVSAHLMAIPCGGTEIGRALPRTETSDVLWRAIRAMAAICSWVLLFRVMLAFLERWILWILPQSVQVLVSGMLELTNGCLQLGKIPDERVRFLAACAMVSFGGLCVLLQTSSVTKGLSLKWYFLGKVIQAASSVLMGYGIVYRSLLGFVPFAVIGIFIFVKKEVDFRPWLVYNEKKSKGGYLCSFVKK